MDGFQTLGQSGEREIRGLVSILVLHVGIINSNVKPMCSLSMNQYHLPIDDLFSFSF